jgi:hypothetical protein
VEQETFDFVADALGHAVQGVRRALRRMETMTEDEVSIVMGLANYAVLRDVCGDQLEKIAGLVRIRAERDDVERNAAKGIEVLVAGGMSLEELARRLEQMGERPIKRVNNP